MKEPDRSKADEEKPEGLTLCKPEDQIFQKLHLCKYLGELYEAAEGENDIYCSVSAMTLQSCHSGLDPESSLFDLDSRFRACALERYGAQARE